MVKVATRTGVKHIDVKPSEVDNDEALYSEKELNGPADALVEAVDQYLTRTEGQVSNPERVKELATKLLNRRLG